jgi:integrase
MQYTKRKRYQEGSLKRVPRAHGWAWEYRYYATSEDGVRKLRVQTFSGAQYPTELDVRKALAPMITQLNSDTAAGQLSATMGTVMDKYLSQELPKLRHSTQCTNRSLIDLHIRPRWKKVRPSNVEAGDVVESLETLNMGAASRARARNLISRMLDLAMLWKYMPVGRNPMQLVKVKGSTKRSKKITVLSPDTFRALVSELPEPYNLMVLLSGCLGLRVSEVLGLKWRDFDSERRILTINQIFTHGQVQMTAKTEASEGNLPLHPRLWDVLTQWRSKQEDDYGWVFPGKRGTPYSDATILAKVIKPIAKRLGIEHIGWHTFRHSYRTWLTSQQVDLGRTKDLMRHSDIATTMNVYGAPVSEEMRKANALVVKQLL